MPKFFAPGTVRGRTTKKIKNNGRSPNPVTMAVFDTIFKRVLRDVDREAAEFERKRCIAALKECEHVCATAQCDCVSVQKLQHIEAVLRLSALSGSDLV